MGRLRFQGCTRLVLALVASLLWARASAFELTSAQEASPGHVVVTMTVPKGPAGPQPSDLVLRLDDKIDVRASKVEGMETSAAPAWLLLTLDHSGSMGAAAVADIKAAVTTAITGGGAPELPFKVGVMAFGNRSVHLLPFTGQASQVAPALSHLSLERGADGKTRLFDAIAGGLATLRAEKDGAKRLLVVSDGKDEGSTLSAQALGKLAQVPTNPIPIDTISYGAQAQGNSGSLSSVAGSTGGRFVQAANARELGDALRRLIQDLGPAAPYKVSFDYTPAPNKRVTEAVLVLAGANAQTTKRPLPIPVSAAVEAAPPAAVDKPAPTPAPKPNPIADFLSALTGLLRNLPALFALLAASVLAIAVLLLLMRRDKSKVEPAPGPISITVANPPPAPPPPPPARPRRPGTQVGHAWPEPRPGQPTAILRGVAGTARGGQFKIEKPLYRIGCAPENDLVLVGDDFASGAHALIRAEAQGLYVEDLGSLNGTSLNGVTFKSATRSLSPGDELRFGHTTVQVMPGSPASGPAMSGLEPAAR